MPTIINKEELANYGDFVLSNKIDEIYASISTLNNRQINNLVHIQYFFPMLYALMVFLWSKFSWHTLRDTFP